MSNSYNVREISKIEYSKWDNFVELSPQGSIFNKSWWISIVSNSFRILVCEENNEIIGGIVLPYIYNCFYKNPKLTPTLGVLFKDFSSLKKSNKESKEIDIARNLIMNLPKSRLFEYGFSYNFENCLPFKWADFNIDVTYTYVIENLSHLDKIFDGFKTNIKTDIRKAIKNGISVREDLDINDFYEVNQKTFKRQSMEMPYNRDFLINLDKTLSEHNARKIMFAVDEHKKIHAAAYIIYDKRSAYYLMGGGDPDLRNSGATSLVIWEAIKSVSTITERFDFEGSSVENIEKFFRAFGGTPKLILNITKCSILVRLIVDILKSQKNLLRRIGII